MSLPLPLGAHASPAVLASITKKNKAHLRIAGVDFDGWTHVNISRSIENASASFTFGATDRWPGSSNPIRIPPAAACQVLIGDDTVITGYIDEPAFDYDANHFDLSASGRSKTLDAIDCSVISVPAAWSKLNPLQIASLICLPYGVLVVADVDVGGPIDHFAAEPGETCQAAIDRLATLRALLITDDEQGRLVLTRAGAGRATTALVTGQNIKSARGSFNAAERYSEYRCQGQRVADETDFGSACAGVEAFATDDGLGRKRVLVVQAEGPVDTAGAKRRATWEAATRAGKSVALEYVVQGWRQGDGRLWAPNQLVQVRDTMGGVDDELLIVSCTFALDMGGTTTALQLAPAAGYELLEPRKIRRGSPNKVGAWKELVFGIKVPTT